MTTTVIRDPVAGGFDLDCRVALHPLVYLREGAEVTVGRRDIDSYAVFPADGAALVRRLELGVTPRAVAAWYTSEYGEGVDIVDVLTTLAELRYVAVDGEQHAAAGPPRWQRLGRAAFSPVAWACYALVVMTGVLAAVRAPALVPRYTHVFFGGSYTLVQLVLVIGQIPLVFVHEWYHVLAGRRLSLRSRISVGRRLYFVVFETSLDGLVTVPRRQRYLPILAGMLADLVIMAGLTDIAYLCRGPDGSLSLAGRLALAFAFTTLLRLIWQFHLYLRTDLYVLVSTALGCSDLHGTAIGMLRDRLRRLLRRPGRTDRSQWHPADVRVARWYSWLVVAGYGCSLAVLVLAVGPALGHVLAGLYGRLTAGREVLDSVAFLTANSLQFVIVGGLAWRDRRRRHPRRSTT